MSDNKRCRCTHVKTDLGYARTNPEADCPVHDNKERGDKGIIEKVREDKDVRRGTCRGCGADYRRCECEEIETLSAKAEIWKEDAARRKGECDTLNTIQAALRATLEQAETDIVELTSVCEGWQRLTEDLRVELKTAEAKVLRLASEKERRIKYQDCVYKLCNIADNISGRSVRKGTGILWQDLLAEFDKHRDLVAAVGEFILISKDEKPLAKDAWAGELANAFRIMCATLDAINETGEKE